MATDVMVDLETTHTDPEEGAILQIGAIKFNYDTMEVGEMFDRCPAMLPRRNWSSGTQEFWRKHMDVYQTIVARQEPARGVFEDFSAWISKDAPANGYRFWAKPTKFDWPFVESHFIQLDMPMPFPHWNAMDLNSHIGGMRGTAEPVDYSIEVPFNGLPHNALHDAAHQIDILAYAKRTHVFAELIA